MTFPIAYIAGQFPLRSETFVYREVRALRARGWPVHTFGLHAPAEETPADLVDLRDTTGIAYAGSAAARVAMHPGVAAGASIDALKESGPSRERMKLIPQAAAGAALAKRFRALGVRHLHAHFAHAPASVAMYAASAAGTSFSFTGHANDLFQRRQALKLKLSRAAFVGCISEWHRELYRSILPRDDDAYPIIRCGVDTDSLSPTPHTRGRRVLTVCRLVEKKGVDTLIRAAALLAKRGATIELVVAGEGPLRPALELLAAELNVAVTFLGSLDAAGVRAELGRADAFALACRVDSNGDRDGIPVVLMEAMACGLPCVSGDLPAIRELVLDRRTGLLVPGGDDEATARAIDSALRDESFGDAGRRWVVDKFSLRGTVEQLEQSIARATTAASS